MPRTTTRKPTAPPAAETARHAFGSHLSIAGGMHHAIEAALRLGLDTVQVFVKNQRQWRASPLRPDDLRRWHELLQTSGFRPPTAHATYLINLASADESLRERSWQAFAEELQRCDQLSIPYLVIHPGAAGEASPESAIERVSDSLNRIFAEHPGIRAMPLLETTAGQGTTLGRSFAELGAILAGLREPRRVGVCVDTCHVFAAGYDIRSKGEYKKMMDEAQRHVGMERIRCWHLNDSRGELGSHLDRHEHIGCGRIGVDGFVNVLHDARFLHVPMILETPKETAEDGRDWDAVNVALLRRLEQPGESPRTTKRGMR